MLRAYPKRFIEADGDAKCFLLLDAFKIFAQQSSNPNVASTTYSDYKGHCTIKFLCGVDNIGCPHAKTVPDGGMGRHADGSMTKESGILKETPFSHSCKTDKGFIIDNDAAAEGVIIDRPQKQMKH